MGVSPNLVVGLVGLVLFAGTGAVILADFDDLAGTVDYAATVRAFPRASVPLSNTLGSAATRTESFPIGNANVTEVTVRVTWTETGLPIARHMVTVTVRDPANRLVGEETGIGAAGVTVGRMFLKVPIGSRFSATPDAAAAAFLERYPAHDEGRGTWTLKVTTDTPAQPGAGSLTYTATLDTRHYAVAYRPDVPRK